MEKTLDEMLNALKSAAGEFNSSEFGRVSRDIVQHIDDNIATHPKGFVNTLQVVVDAFDRAGAELLCKKLVVHLRTRSEPYPVQESKRILSVLRRKRYFDLVSKVADILIQTQQDDPNIQKQFAQALIDQSQFSAGLDVLHKLEKKCVDTDNERELAEAKGLIGRVHKQLYMDASADGKPGSLICDHLNKSVNSYFEVYEQDHEKNWHGVNTLALIARAQHDGIPLDERFPNLQTLSEKLYSAVVSLSEPTMWDYAIAAEACLAQRDYTKALEWIVKYTDPVNKTADAFEYASTLRQFEEVWRLNDDNPEQEKILHLLRSALLKAEGGQLEFENTSQHLTSIDNLKGDRQYEKVLGPDRYKSFLWYLKGVEQASGVAQFCNRSGDGFGTGFLLRGEDVHPRFKTIPLVLVTNAHVVSNISSEQNSIPGACSPDEVLVRFEASDTDQHYEVGKILYSSRRNELDCTILTFGSVREGLRGIKPLRVASDLPAKGANKRVYIIGHPKGGKLSFSINDNLLIDHEAPKVHYRAPTEGGSSGSPVFDENWGLIALHHSGGFKVNKLHGQSGTYAANEGMSIQSILTSVDSMFHEHD